MKRISLSAKTLLLALLNLFLLGLVFSAFARWQFRFDLPTYLATAASERIGNASGQLSLELEEMPASHWNSALRRFASRYPATLYLFDYKGKQLAGPAVHLPGSLLQALAKDPFAMMEERRHSSPETPSDALNRLDDEAWGGDPSGSEKEQQNGKPEPADRGPAFQSSGVSAPEARSNSRLPLLRTDHPQRYWTGVRIPMLDPQTGRHIHAAVIWQTSSFWTNPFFIDYRPWFIVLVAVLSVSALTWIPPIRNLTRAVTRLTFVTGQIADGHFDIVLPTKRRDELGRLSDSINRMAKRLAGYVNGQKRFLGDIAHELSSPVARMQVGLSILEQRADDQQVEYLKDVREEVEHMSTLVSELLAFSKFQLKTQAKGLTPILLNEVVDRAISREKTDDVQIVFHQEQPVQVLGSSEYLFRAVANVLRNAVRYAGSAGPISVSIDGEQGKNLIGMSIEDEGPGLPESELENVFRPFYRPEFARQRETGGTGLGLAIVRDCVESCGGTVQIRNRLPSGLRVEFHLQRA